MILNKYDIILQSVEEEDAGFIIDLRTNAKKSRFISETNSSVEIQKEWIKKYKEREKEKQEYYFVAIDENKEKFATYRIYDIKKNICEIGSWVSKPNYANTINSIKVDIIMKEFAFDNLGFENVKFEVRKENFSVIKYHKLFEPIVVNETTDNIYFILEKQSFYKNRNRIFKNIK